MSEDFDLKQDGVEEEEDTQEGKYLTFQIGSEEYGFGIRFVTEIIGIQRITEVPDVPMYIKGVINLRGKVIPVVDVRLRFNMQERDYDERTCIIVVNVNNTAVGLIVDSVSEVINIAADDIEEPPQVNKGKGSQYIAGLGKVGQDVKILLDIQRLLYDDQIEKVSGSIESE